MNPRPIVGILAQELSYSLMEIFANKTSYIGAAYVKYIEAAGARVVPVLINQVSFLPFIWVFNRIDTFICRSDLFSFEQKSKNNFVRFLVHMRPRKFAFKPLVMKFITNKLMNE